MNLTDEKGIHDGHRARMRDKLVTHGGRFFDTYELLEMLLYHAVPYRDTNPIAKRLLSAFGSLDGVLSAKRGELMTVNGVGEHAASLIVTVGEMLSEVELSRYNSVDAVFDDYTEMGNYVTEYFASREGLSVACFFLDGGMRLLDVTELYGVDFGSAAVRSKPFIDRAMRTGATLVIFASMRDHAALFPMPCDVATVQMLSNNLGSVGVRVVEHYIVSGGQFVGSLKCGFVRLGSDTEELLSFVRSKEAANE